MKLFLLILLILLSGFLYSQDGFPGMTGGYGDLKFILPQTLQPNGFSFARLVYNGRVPNLNKNWYTDYPEGDKTIVTVLKRITNIDVASEWRAIPINSPDLFKYPFLYSSEGGQMILDDSDVDRMRKYLNRGGFWMTDDFWGSNEWDDFERQIKKIFPEREIVDFPLAHPIFHTVFDIEKILQVPNIFYAYCGECPTWEQDGYKPQVKGIFNDNGDLMVVIFFNTDIMDAAEWADNPLYPHRFSTYAYKIFVNTVVYAMTH